MPQIVFLTLFLGLVSGIQPVELQVDPAIKSVSILVAGQKITSLTHGPWRVVLDFGPQLDPRLLEAVGFDDHGQEIARASQTLNLPRRVAEVEIALENRNERPTAVELRWTHRIHARPKRATVTADGKKLVVDRRFRAPLPQLDWSLPHVVSAEMRFSDGIVARRDLVISGSNGYSESVGSQLTPIIVTTAPGQEPGSLDGCFFTNGIPAHVSAVEKTNALVIMVKDPEATETLLTFAREMGPRPTWIDKDAARRDSRLDPDSTERILWPTAETYQEEGKLTSELFEPSVDVDASRAGMLWLLTRSQYPGLITHPRRFADAVATAGISALAQGRRRAVVLVLSNKKDLSRYSPVAVRRYLEAIGVPLVVWSLSGDRPDLVSSWGEVEDISSRVRLRAAVERLKYTLAIQHVAWIAADPLSALRLTAKEGCGAEPLAKLH